MSGLRRVVVKHQQRPRHGQGNQRLRLAPVAHRARRVSAPTGQRIVLPTGEPVRQGPIAARGCSGLSCLDSLASTVRRSCPHRHPRSVGRRADPLGGELARRAGPSRGHSLLHGWLMQRNPGVGSDRRWTVKGSELALALCSLDWLRRGARRGKCGTVSSQPHLERGGRSITVTAGKEVEQRTTEQRERGGPLGQSGRG